MSDQRRRFKRWRATRPNRVQYLADLILAEIVPLFEQERFVWYPDYAGGDIQQVSNSCIPLQRREGEFWPTVEIAFDRRDRPSFYLDFALQPPNCRRYTKDGWEAVAQSDAALVDGYAIFRAKGTNWLAPDRFGYLYLSLWPRRRLRKDVAVMARRLPEIFRVFDSGELERATDTPKTAEGYNLMFVGLGKYD